LKHLKTITKLNGTTYTYYAKPGFKLVPLPRLPENHPDFVMAYSAAAQSAPKTPSVREPKEGTIGALVVSYKRSAAFRGLRKSTQDMRRRILDKIADVWRDGIVVDLAPRHINADIAALTPHAANNRLKVWRALMKHTVSIGMIETNPARDVERHRTSGGGHHCWSDDEIALYRAHHQTGTKARLAFELALWTGARRGDLVLMGRQHLSGGSLTYTSQKTVVDVCIPVLPEFRAEMDQMPRNQMLFLETVRGKPHSDKAFGAWFSSRCREAGLPAHCSVHGLRKARARIMAETGKTTHAIAAWGGWRTLSEVAHYTEAVNRRKLTHAGIEQERNSGNSVEPVSKNAEKPNKFKEEK
jgi:integrase